MYLNGLRHWGMKISSLRMFKTVLCSYFWNFSWVAWLLVRGRSSEHGSDTCHSILWWRAMKKGSLAWWLQSRVMARRSQFYFGHFHLKPWFSKAYQDVLKYFAELRTDCKIHVWEKARTSCMLQLNENLNWASSLPNFFLWVQIYPELQTSALLKFILWTKEATPY